MLQSYVNSLETLSYVTLLQKIKIPPIILSFDVENPIDSPAYDLNVALGGCDGERRLGKCYYLDERSSRHTSL